MFRAMSNASTLGNSSRRYNVDPIYDNQSVHYALLHSYARDPEYVKAVLRSYIEVKKSHGRVTNDISLKLNYLEQQLPQYAESFHAVRAEYRLPPSRVLPASTALAATSSRLSLAPTVSRLSQSRVSPPRSPRRSSERPNATSTSDAALPAEFRVRPQRAADEGEELPPPPYARQDPEPDSTRILQERLAAEAISTLPPDTSPTPASPRPESSRVARSRRTSSLHQRPARTPSPPHRPEDEEMARAFEENQLEEAKRASLLMEQERKELEEAMRLSLAVEQASGSGLGQAGSSPSAGPSRSGGSPSAQGMNRSSLGNAGTPPQASAMPGTYQSSHLEVPYNSGLSLLDSDDMDGAQQAPLVPQKTGAVMQSKNPFLSQSEAKSPGNTHVQQQGGSPLLQPVQQSDRRSSPTLPNGHLPQQRDLPASPAGRALPRPPKQQASQPGYSAPADPPPGFPWAGDNGPAPMGQPPQGINNQIDHAPAPPVPDAPSSTSAAHPPDPADPLHSLSYYDIVFLMDDGPSMAGERWGQAKGVLMKVAGTAMRYAEDGVDVYFTNSKRVGRELKNQEDLDDLLGGLQARGNASLGYRLRSILRDYMERLVPPELLSPGGMQRRDVRPMNLVIITDGVCAQRSPESEHAGLAEDSIERVIVDCARDLDNAGHPPSQIGIQFLQIGSDPHAREALQQLDDAIASTHGVRDMVDTVVHAGPAQNDDPEWVQKVLFGGIDRGWDDYNL